MVNGRNYAFITTPSAITKGLQYSPHTSLPAVSKLKFVLLLKWFNDLSLENKSLT